MRLDDVAAARFTAGRSPPARATPRQFRCARGASIGGRPPRVYAGAIARMILGALPSIELRQIDRVAEGAGKDKGCCSWLGWSPAGTVPIPPP